MAFKPGAFGRGQFHLLSAALGMRRVGSLAMLFGVFALLFAGTGSAMAADTIHIVQPGERLTRIAEQYDVPMTQLAAYNGISDPDRVLIGQILSIPHGAMTQVAPPPAETLLLPATGGYHMVVPGDMLSQIAKEHGMSVTDLMRLNGLHDADSIVIGQKLRVSARVGATGLESQSELALADAIHIVGEGETLAQIAQSYGMALSELLVLNGLPNPNFVWTGQRLRVKQAPTPEQTMAAAKAPVDGKRRIEINLTNQTLTAWQGDVAILRTYVSTGKATTPTVPGQFAIYNKLDSQHMSGDGYDLPGVPWVMYYYGDFAIHGAYWHANFGVPTSHGCTNMVPEEAAALYEWANVGTEVSVHY